MSYSQLHARGFIAARTTRRFHILWMLDDRKPLRSEDLAAHFGVSQRAIYRDMAYLRPVTDAFAGIGGGYLRKR